MRLNSNPLFRKIIIPWYDSPPVCWVLIATMVVLVLFSITGIIVAEYNPEYAGFVWVPITLLLLSLFMVFVLCGRIIRHYNQLREE
jgi:cytochrome b subunit of formate dehydrogenase